LFILLALPTLVQTVRDYPLLSIDPFLLHI
jgi:hypothetical protein